MYNVYCVLTIFLTDSQKFAIRREADTPAGLFKDLVADHLVFRSQVPHPQSLVITDRGTDRLCGVHTQAPQLSLHVTLQSKKHKVELHLLCITTCKTMIDYLTYEMYL